MPDDPGNAKALSILRWTVLVALVAGIAAGSIYATTTYGELELDLPLGYYTLPLEESGARKPVLIVRTRRFLGDDYVETWLGPEDSGSRWFSTSFMAAPERAWRTGGRFLRTFWAKSTYSDRPDEVQLQAEAGRHPPVLVSIELQELTNAEAGLEIWVNEERGTLKKDMHVLRIRLKLENLALETMDLFDEHLLLADPEESRWIAQFGRTEGEDPRKLEPRKAYVAEYMAWIHDEQAASRLKEGKLRLLQVAFGWLIPLAPSYK